jgi:hypothetical protein
MAVELGGWLAAGAAGFAAAGVWRALACRMEAVARACHELRGPLTAARLGLDYDAGNGQLTPARVRAIDLELGRAAQVLDDLEGVRAGRDRPRADETWRVTPEVGTWLLTPGGRDRSRRARERLRRGVAPDCGGARGRAASPVVGVRSDGAR